MKKNSEVRSQESEQESGGFRPATTKVDHQIYDLEGVQKRRLFIHFFVTLVDSLSLRYQNSILNSGS
ncbi:MULTISPECIES: hypothetical protein [unclassified Nostoc]|nr:MULTISPECIES: hypothetical protein [unclassified Nostoc]MDZ8126973.1 hypothetical protein [Nostoc sp. CmiVER01]MDZ8223205.1 hypothetical protein [Nostoc sp. ChiVER01]